VLTDEELEVGAIFPNYLAEEVLIGSDPIFSFGMTTYSNNQTSYVDFGEP
jgi:hypothetical protein